MPVDHLQTGLHICPDCQATVAEGIDRFDKPNPCPECMWARIRGMWLADVTDPQLNRPITFWDRLHYTVTGEAANTACAIFVGVMVATVVLYVAVVLPMKAMQ